MATEFDRLSHFIEDILPIETDGTRGSPGPARGKAAAVAVATRNEIEAAGLEALLQADGYSVVARCASEADLLRCSESKRPDIIVLAENIVWQEAAKTILRLRAHNRSVAIVFLLEEGDAIKPVDLLELEVRGIVLSATGARIFLDCVDSVRHGRTWVDPDLLRHLAVAERSPQMASSLTPREGDIARLVSRGLQNKEIARVLDLAEGTVKMHLHHIYEKLQLGSRTQLALSMAAPFARTAASGNGHGAGPAAESGDPNAAHAAKIVSGD